MAIFLQEDKNKLKRHKIHVKTLFFFCSTSHAYNDGNISCHFSLFYNLFVLNKMFQAILKHSNVETPRNHV